MRTIAICLLLAGLVPAVSRDATGGFHFHFLAPPPLTALLAPGIGRFMVVYYLLAGAAMLVLERVLKERWHCWVMLGVGLLLPVLLISQVGVRLASSGAFSLDTGWDWVLFIGFVLTTVGLGLLGNSSQWRYAVVAAAGGALLLAWLLCPRPVSYYESWFGLDRLQAPEQAPVVASLLRRFGGVPVVRMLGYNWMMPQGTHPMFYFWWNLLVFEGVLMGAVAVCLPLVPGEEARSSLAFLAMIFGVVLVFALMLLPVGTGLHFLQVSGQHNNLDGDRALDTVLRVVNGLRIWLPPWLLAVCILLGLVEGLGSVLQRPLPSPAQPGPAQAPPAAIPVGPASSAPQAIPVAPAPTTTPVTGWFRAVGKRRVGPLSLAAMQRLAAAGQLNADDMVLPPGGTRWGKANAFPALFQPSPSLPAQPAAEAPAPLFEWLHSDKLRRWFLVGALPVIAIVVLLLGIALDKVFGRGALELTLLAAGFLFLVAGVFWWLKFEELPLVAWSSSTTSSTGRTFVPSAETKKAWRSLNKGRLDEAQLQGERVLVIARAKKDAGPVSDAHHLLGLIAQVRREWDEAGDHLTQALASARQQLDLEQAQLAQMGHPNLWIAEGLGDPCRLWNRLLCLAALAVERGAPNEAAKYLAEVNKEPLAQADQFHSVVAPQVIALLADEARRQTRSDDLEQARYLYRRALSIHSFLLGGRRKGAETIIQDYTALLRDMAQSPRADDWLKCYRT